MASYILVTSIVYVSDSFAGHKYFWHSCFWPNGTDVIVSADPAFSMPSLLYLYWYYRWTHLSLPHHSPTSPPLPQLKGKIHGPSALWTQCRWSKCSIPMPLTGNNARYSVYMSTNEKHSGTEYRELLSYDLSWELDLTEVYNHINTPALFTQHVQKRVYTNTSKHVAEPEDGNCDGTLRATCCLHASFRQCHPLLSRVLQHQSVSSLCFCEEKWWVVMKETEHITHHSSSYILQSFRKLCMMCHMDVTWNRIKRLMVFSCAGGQTR